MKELISIKESKEKIVEIDKLVKVVFKGFMATSLDYGYHIKNTFGSHQKEDKNIFEFRDNIRYRLESATLHFNMLLFHKAGIENRFTKMLKKDPQVFKGFILRNPYFDRAADEIMAIFDSVIFHLSSAFDYLAMLMQFVFGKNPESRLQWITLAKHCYNKESDFGNRSFTENIKNVDSQFVSQFNDYRAELIHRKKSTSFANVAWELTSGKVDTQFECSSKIKSKLKKILDKKQDYCMTYVTYKAIKETVTHIAHVFEGINDEFRNNYHPNAPIMDGNGFQIVSYNPDSKFAESPSLPYWKDFMEYKNLC